MDIRELPVPEGLGQGREIPLDASRLLLKSLFTTRLQPDTDAPIAESYEVRINKWDMNQARLHCGNLTSMGLSLGKYEIKELYENGDVFAARVPYHPVGRYQIQSEDNNGNQVLIVHIFTRAQEPIPKKEVYEVEPLTFDTGTGMYVLAKQNANSTCYLEGGTDMITTFDAGIGIEVKGAGSIRRHDGSVIHGLLVKIEGESENLLVPEKYLSKFVIGKEVVDRRP